MARKAKRQAPRKPARAKAKTRPTRKAMPRRKTSSRRDPLDDFITTATRALDLPAQKAWLPAVKANLRVTLLHAATVAEFKLPDDAEPAPVFKA
jgi:hypothetical protein